MTPWGAFGEWPGGQRCWLVFLIPLNLWDVPIQMHSVKQLFKCCLSGFEEAFSMLSSRATAPLSFQICASESLCTASYLVDMLFFFFLSLLHLQQYCTFRVASNPCPKFPALGYHESCSLLPQEVITCNQVPG